MKTYVTLSHISCSAMNIGYDFAEWSNKFSAHMAVQHPDASLVKGADDLFRHSLNRSFPFDKI